MLMEDLMRKAGSLMSNNTFFNNEELKTAIEGTKLTLAYLESRGSKFDLVTSRLQDELRQLLFFRRERIECEKISAKTE